jgi:ZU5 domain
MKRFRGWRAAVVPLFIGAAACSEVGPTQPEAQYGTAGGPSELPRDLSSVAEYANPQSSRKSMTAWIGPMGGTLRLLDVEIVVPPGAVTAPTRFRIRLPGDPKQLALALAELQPHGMTFLQPVTVRLPYRGTTAEGFEPIVIWWSGESWIRFPTTLLPDGRVQTQTDHFSFFGTGLFRGITPVGG